MALLLIFALAVLLFALFGAASEAWGVDSRPSIGDDHARSGV